MDATQNNLLDPMSSFEDFKKENGIMFWWASDFAKMLGYSTLASFQKAINRAKQAFMSSGIAEDEEIIPTERDIQGMKVKDYKLTRFACYMIAQNGDPKKPEVAYAQRYFAEQTRRMQLAQLQADQIERVVLRDEIKEGNKGLSSAIASMGAAGNLDFAIFQNEGFRGMYNKMVYQLESFRGIKKGQLYEHMGRTELAANLFRITMTEERLKLDGITSQQAAGAVHRAVGQEVRGMVRKNTGLNPEDLPVERHPERTCLETLNNSPSNLSEPWPVQPRISFILSKISFV